MPTGKYTRSKEQLLKLKEISNKPRKLRNGKYNAIHKWLNKKMGKATTCLNPNCKGISKTYHYCLIKGERHEHNINNYISLCSSCHRLYDQTDEWINKIKESRLNYTHSIKTKNKISLACKGINIGNKNSAKHIMQYDLKNNFIKEWDCILDAARKLNINSSGITMCAKKQLKQSGGYIWIYPVK